MAEVALKTHLLALMREALGQVQTSGSQLQPGQGGTATYDQARDNEIIGLPSFALAVTALEPLPQFLPAAAPSEAKRVILQFTYDFLERQSSSDLDENAYEETWSSFWDELERPEWTYLAICYLENFTSEADFLELGDGVTIHNRSSYQWTEMGWSRFQIEKLYENWRGSDLHVLVVEERVPKSPDNLILMGTGHEVSKAFRMLRVLRLTKEGDVHIGGGTAMLGRVLTNRRAGSGFADNPGASMHGSIARWPGARYSLTASDTSHVKDLHSQLKTVEDMGGGAPYNLSLALRSFNSSYDRIPAQNDMKLVDLITTAESLLGASVEISFRLAFYVAGILAGTDRERVIIFDEMRAFYDTRNKVVHGGTLESKHRTRLNNYPRLRDYVRRLLVAFLHLATTSEHGHHPKSFRKQLDSNLQDAQKRSALRAAMGLAADRQI
jgi:hypothetical protein